MTISKNPTKTGSIEKAWLRDLSKRWRKYKQATLKLLTDQNKALTTNAAEPFAMDASQIRVYMTFIESQIRSILLGTDSAPNWQARYQFMSYQRALEVTRAQLASQGAGMIRTPEEQAAGLALQPFTATPSLSTGVITQPIHQGALQFLYTRSYESLKGWTDKLAIETRQILMDGLEQGKGIREVRRQIYDRIGVSKARSELIARTETIQAYQRSASAEAARLEEELGEPIKMRWLSAEDSRVRPLHASYHGTLVSPSKNFERISISPWNCRCSQVATLEDSITPKTEEKFRKQRERLMILASK